MATIEDIQASDVGKGWYVKQVITDLQSGKVDEFVKKEGKWFNYLKGEATTFTNAADNNGAIDGNVDIAEFTVQGIGTLSANATVSSGTTPVLGGNVNVTFTGGGNWNTTGYQAYNISTLPSTATFIIYPNAGYGISAVSLNALAPTFESWVTDITFSDNGTPNVAGNTVTGTITFDTTQSITSGVTLSDEIELSYFAAPAVLAFKAIIKLNGLFSVSGSGIQDTYSLLGTSFDTLETYYSSSTEQHILVTKYVDPSQQSTILDLVITRGSITTWLGSTMPSVLVEDQDGASEVLAEYVSEIDFGSSSNSRTVKVKYTPGTPILNEEDTNNIITVDFNTVVGVCDFNTGMSPFPVFDNGGIVSIPIITNLGPFTVEEVSGDIDITTISEIYNSSSTYHSVSLDCVANSSGSPLTGVISLTSNSNYTGTPNATLNITQGLLNTVVIKCSINAIVPEYIDPTNYGYSAFTSDVVGTAGWFSDVNGGLNPIIPAEQTTIMIQTFFDEMGAGFDSNNGAGDYTIIYSEADDTGWINSTNGYGQAVNGENAIQEQFTVSAQPLVGGTERNAIISHAHPQDPTLTDSIHIKQEAGYNASTNTLKFYKQNTDSTFTEISEGIYEIDDENQEVEIFAQIPVVDTFSDNAFIPSITQQEQQNITTYTNFQFSGGPNYYVNADLNDGSFDPADDLDIVWTESWIYGLTAIPVFDNFDSSNNMTHRINFTINPNYNVSQTDSSYSVDRDFLLYGRNPENPSSDSDNSVTIRQLAIPLTTFGGYSESELTIPPSYDGNGYNIIAKANGSTPTCGSYSVVQYNADGTTSNILGVPSWLTGTAFASTGNTGEYNVSLSIDENFGVSDREFRLGLWHSTVEDPFTTNPSIANNKTDFVDIIQQPASLTLSISTTFTNISTSGGFHFNGEISPQSPSLDGQPGSQYTGYLSGSQGAGTFTIPILYNGTTPVVLDIEYQEGSGGYTSGVPSWASTPTINASNQLIITFNSGISSSTRDIKFKLAHGENNTAFHRVQIMQFSSF